jgi:hypothetical protein
MANILGSLFVELKANTSAFVEGMSAASYAAKRAGRDIQDSFEQLGGVASSLLAPFGEIGSVIGETLDKVGAWSGSASKGIAGLAGGMSPLAVGAGAAVAAIAAAEVGAIALSIHTAEAAAKMLVLSKQTGVSVETLSGFGFVAKQSGIDSDVMSNGLAKLNKAIFAAATAAPSAQNAFTRLKVAVKENGEIRDTQDVLLDLVDKFKGIESPAVRGALAIQLFGKSGFNLLPFLMQGRAGIEELLKTAEALGIVLDTQTAEASHRFEQSLNTIAAAGQGIALQLTKQLLPALQTVAQFLVDGLKDKSSTFSSMISGLATLTKGTIAVGQTFYSVFAQIGIFLGDFLGILNTVVNTVAEIALTPPTDFGKIGSIAKEGYNAAKAQLSLFLSDSKKLWTDNEKFIKGVYAPIPKLTPEKGGGGTDVDLSKEKVDKVRISIENQIKTLQAAAAAELNLAAATTESVAAQNLQIAAGEADKLISKLLGEADKQAGAEKEKLLAYIHQEETAIRALTAEKQVAKDAISTNKELQKETDAYANQIAGLEAMVAAYRIGGQAIAAAGVDKQLEADRTKVRTLEEEYARLSGMEGVTKEALDQLSDAITAANDKLEEHRAQLTAIEQLKIEEEITKATTAFRDSAPFVALMNRAYMDSAAAIRDADVALKAWQWTQANPGASAAQVEEMRQLFQAQAKDAYAQQIAQEAGALTVGRALQDELEKLQNIKGAMEDYGRSTLLVDAAIYDANNRAIEQWDTAANKVGTLTDKFRALMNELALEGQNFSGKIFEAFHTAIDGMEDQLAKFVVTGKANFKQVFQSLEESIVKAGIQKVVGSIGSAINNKFFGGAIPGLGTKADGSSTSPFYMIPVDSSGNILGGLGGGGGDGGDGGGDGGDGGGDGGDGGGDGGDGGGDAGGIGGIFGSLFSKIGGGLGSLFGGIGEIFSKIFSFIPGLAGGGDVTPGRAYIVGEKHPEFFVPNQPGQVSPSLQMGSGPQQTVVNFHVHGVQDVDSFKRSRGQIMAGLHQQLATAYARNR